MEVLIDINSKRKLPESNIVTFEWLDRFFVVDLATKEDWIELITFLQDIKLLFQTDQEMWTDIVNCTKDVFQFIKGELHSQISPLVLSLCIILILCIILLFYFID